MHKVEPEWRDVPGWENLYRVSDAGDVFSLRAGRNLKPRPETDGHTSVVLCLDGRREPWLTHRLILSAFVGPCPEGLEGCHDNGIPDDNRLANLYWGTRSENTFDKIRHGNHPFANRDVCSSGHEYTEANTYHHPRGIRQCRECMKRYKKKYNEKRA